MDHGGESLKEKGYLRAQIECESRQSLSTERRKSDTPRSLHVLAGLRAEKYLTVYFKQTNKMKFFTLVSVLAFALESGAEVTSLRGNSFEEQANEASLTEVRETSSDALCLNYCRPVKPNSNSHRDWRRWQEEGRKSWGGHWGGGGNDWRKWQNPENWGGGRHSWGGHGGWGGGRNTCNRSHCTCCGASRHSPSYPVGRSAVCVAGFCSSEEEVKYFETFLQAVKDESLGGLCNESSCTCCNPIGSHYEVDPGSYCPVGFCDSDEEVDDFEDLMEAVEDSLAQVRQAVQLDLSTNILD
ncbi:hypothetical protein THAOC_22259 [Thalassiosira oceanica]|uniref:Uncharacterized protein n=1 Tax=Thalassiosira oceanica TaxID=159749 RepID=K0RXK6_THAOC|nr:hypothetical protein THAOC_22259 [Thalassiosira oceanica]|eukprot:EJK57670.1 hypothetical protein THAOC_22259 [Thalassiosira oceanica]